jgi:hypothetical protein
MMLVYIPNSPLYGIVSFAIQQIDKGIFLGETQLLSNFANTFRIGF